MSILPSTSFSSHFYAWLQIPPSTPSFWRCMYCTLENSIEYVQCEACHYVNFPLQSLLTILQHPYKTREISISTSVRSLVLTSLTGKTTGNVREIVEKETGYQWVTDTWKCAVCGNYNPVKRVWCVQCGRRNSKLRRILDASEWPYIASSELIREDDIPEPIDSYLSERLNLHRDFLYWTCPRCTTVNASDFIQCQACLTVHTKLQQFNKSLRAHCKKREVGFLERMMGKKEEVDTHISTLPMLKEFLEQKTGLDGEHRMWTCPECTLRNSYEYIHCRVCNHLNSSLEIILAILDLHPKPRAKSLWLKAQESYYNILDSVIPLVICPVCDVGIPQLSLLSLTNCSHQLHTDCIHDHITSSIDTAKFPILCPVATCMTEIAVSDIHKAVNETEYRSYLQATLRHYIATQADKMRACPTPDCCNAFEFEGDPLFTCQVCCKSYCLRCRVKSHYPVSCEEFKLRLELKPKAEEIMKACLKCGVMLGETGECQTCKVKYCVKCHVPYHTNQTCIEYLHLFRQQQDDKLFLQFVQGSGFKFCHVCSFWVQKNNGCNHITCKCGHQFCYVCGKDWLLGECKAHQFT